MAFADNEVSVDGARPIELFEISYTGNYWYYTSADTEINRGGRIYQPLPISRGEFEPTIDVNKSDLPITFPATVAFADIFRVHPPSEVVRVLILVQNVLGASVDDYVIAWQGRVVNCDFKDPWVELTTENTFSSLNRPGLRRLYSKRCPYALYSAQCGLVREHYVDVTPCLSFSGLTLVAQSAIGKEDGFFAGGYVTWEHATGGNIEKRMIRSSVGATGELVLSGHPIGLVAGAQLSIYPGCDHSLTTCRDKFNNALNYGGTPYIPDKNPFNGAMLY